MDAYLGRIEDECRRADRLGARIGFQLHGTGRMAEFAQFTRATAKVRRLIGERTAGRDAFFYVGNAMPTRFGGSRFFAALYDHERQRPTKAGRKALRELRRMVTDCANAARLTVFVDKVHREPRFVGDLQLVAYELHGVRIGVEPVVVEAGSAIPTEGAGQYVAMYRFLARDRAPVTEPVQHDQQVYCLVDVGDEAELGAAIGHDGRAPLTEQERRRALEDIAVWAYGLRMDLMTVSHARGDLVEYAHECHRKMHNRAGQ